MTGDFNFRSGLTALALSGAVFALSACSRPAADAPAASVPSSTAAASGATPTGIIPSGTATSASSDVSASGANSPKDGSVAIGGVAAHPTMKGEGSISNAPATSGDGAASAPASAPR